MEAADLNDLSTATREIYWNITGTWAMYALFAIAMAVFAYGTYRRIRFWRQGRPDAERLSDWGLRLRIVLKELLFQSRVRGSLLPGLFHGLVFYSFIVLVIATTVVFLDADFGTRLFHGWIYVALTVGAELAGVLMLVGAAIALWRRTVSRPSSIENCAADWVALGLVALLVVTGFLVEGSRIATAGDRWAWLSPVGWGASVLFAGLDGAAGAGVHKALWWGHTVIAMGWIASIPYTKFFHLFSVPANVYFSKIRPRGELKRADIAAMMESEDFDEENFLVGVAKSADFTWKQRLDFDSCVSCGRCEDVCPASIAGHPLSPMVIVQRCHELVMGRIPAGGPAEQAGGGTAGGAADGGNGGGTAGPARTIVGEALDEEVIWHCRTCAACTDVCPAAIDHVDTIMEIRRNEYMLQGRAPQEAARALRMLENTGNPCGPPAMRSDLIAQNNLRVVGPGEAVDVLYWIGCCTTFDPAKQKTATDLFKLLSACGVSFGVLGEDERCCGDPARLIGDERLFQEIAKGEVEALNSRRFRVLLVNCPHCYNVLANEYPQFGGRYNVVHHSQFLHEMLWSGVLRPTHGRKGRVVYHDPCYLGRYQKIYDAPREVLRALPGGEVVEMGRDIKGRSLCCGGGGGHYWMDLEVGKERINNLRVDQAKAAGADTIVTSCPYCQQMLEDSVKSRNLDDAMRVIDIASLVMESLDAKGAAQPPGITEPGGSGPPSSGTASGHGPA